MVEFSTPTRNQISQLVGNDQEMIRAFEKLFTQAGTTTPDQLNALAQRVDVASLDGLQAAAKAEGFQSNIQKVDYLDLNRVGPHTSKARRIEWNDDDGTVDVGLGGDLKLKVGQETNFYAKNTSGSTITIGTPVMFTGALGSSSKLTFSPAVVDSSQPAIYMMGVAAHDIENNAFGYVISFGVVRGFDTSGGPYGETWNDGDIIYFSPVSAGTWTKTRPLPPYLDLPVAVVLSAHSGGAGSIFVRMKTGENLDTLHDVNVSGATNGQFLAFNGTYWEPTAGIAPLPFPFPDETDETSTTYFYLGWENVNGGWLVRRILRADASRVDATVANNPSYANLTSAWPDRTSLTYG